MAMLAIHKKKYWLSRFPTELLKLNLSYKTVYNSEFFRMVMFLQRKMCIFGKFEVIKYKLPIY